MLAGAFALLTRILMSKPQGKASLASRPGLGSVNQRVAGVKEQAEMYTHLHRTGDSSAEDERKGMYQQMVDAYYSLSTDFYEFGWGESFHFAHRYPHETREESIVRHEYALAAKAGLKPGMKVIDVGCGVGGPARNIARFSGADITGVTICDYQVARATAKTERDQLQDQVRFRQADFMKLSETFKPSSFDAAYAIEATCHAPDRTKCFTEVFKILKPGAVFAGYEWVTTNNFNPKDPEHIHIRQQIEQGNGLPYVSDASDVINALKKAGFVIDEVKDLATESKIAWYEPFLPNYSSVNGFGLTPIGIFIIHTWVQIMELLRIAPKGTTQTHSNLIIGAKGLTAGGLKNLFTPMLYFKARKPE